MDANYRADFEEQLVEVEMLQSMFPGQGELDLDMEAVDEVQSWIQKTQPSLDQLPPHIEFRLKLVVDGDDTVEMVVSLPPEYPSLALPQVYVKAERFSRLGQAEINTKLGEFLNGDEVIAGEPCLVSLVIWLQEHAGDFFTVVEKIPIMETVRVEKFLRYWVYSHHIYSKIKRKDLQSLASELRLTGFVMPGKPGVICVEGSAEDVTDWWAVVRNWQWKMIKLKIQEELEAKTQGEVEAGRVFTGFEEIGVLKECQRGNHMDMGEFQKYLQRHNVHWVFDQIFGIDRS